MKKKNLTFIIVTALVALALLTTVVVAVVRQFDTTPADPHAGHNHAPGETHGTQATKNLKVSECYTIKKAEDGTYSVEITNTKGGVMFSEKNLAEKPQVTVVDDNLLSVSGMLSKKNNLSGWAILFNVRTATSSQRYDHVLATKKNHVAFLDRRDDKWVVIVERPYSPGGEFESTELPGLTITKTGSPKIAYRTLESGDLEVSYTTAEGKKKVVLVKMGK